MKRLLACIVLTVAAAAGACSQSGAQDNSAKSPAAALPPARRATPAARPVSSSPSSERPPLVPSIAAPKLGPAGSASSSSAPSTASGTAVYIPHGLITLIGDVKVPAAETGALMEVRVKEGDLIEEGDVLAVVDNRDTLAKQQMAEGELAVAQAQADSTAELEAAQKAAEVAKAEWGQLEEIRKTNPGAVSVQELRRARFQYERALAQIKVAETDREVARLTIGVKKAQLDATAHELDRREIKSPLNGMVVEVFKKQGEWAQPGEPIMRVISLDKLYVEGFVRADQASSGALEGRPAAVKAHVYDPKKQEMVEYNVKGVINYASPVVEGSGRSRQFRVRAEIENAFAENKWAIQPGAMAEMTIDLAPKASIRATGANESRGNRSTPTSTENNDAPPSNSQRLPSLTAPKVESLKPVVPTAERDASEDAEGTSREDDSSKPATPRRSPRPF